MEALETKDPLDILAWQYDIVCNGVELSSGAIRNHRPDIMYKAFEIAGYSKEEVDTNFSGMINAFKFGAPPHGGSAPGIDRIVMLIADEPNIREVILFPMNQKAEDLMMNAPAEVGREAAPGTQHQRSSPTADRHCARMAAPAYRPLDRESGIGAHGGDRSVMIEELLKLRERLARAASDRRSSTIAARIILLEGLQGSGKKSALRADRCGARPVPFHRPLEPFRPPRGERRPLAGALLAESAERRQHDDLLSRLVPARARRPARRAGRRPCRPARLRRDQRVRGAAARRRDDARQAVLHRRSRASRSAGSPRPRDRRGTGRTGRNPRFTPTAPHYRSGLRRASRPHATRAGRPGR